MAKAVALTSDDLAPARTRQQTAARQRGVVPSSELVPMQFRMPPDFAIAFRTEAAKRDMKYNELLQACFTAFMKAHNNEKTPSSS
jgi:hypothetical protein